VKAGGLPADRHFTHSLTTSIRSHPFLDTTGMDFVEGDFLGHLIDHLFQRIRGYLSYERIPIGFPADGIIMILKSG
jgi:hypothetical protein